ncbi:MAG: hypothetical protein EPN20_04880 [Magnetospirillum sp.]|nr:MAG: hypothetical protein EPN20_04880 [Magnetospirillum sp.]
MRRIAALLVLLLLGACYQVEGETVSASASVRVDGVRDGLYRRPDGVEVQVRWNAAERQYDVTPKDGPSGKARAARLVSGVYLVQYVDATRLTLLASVQGSDVVLFAPNKAAEQQMIKAHGLSLRPGPINALVGPAGSVANFFKDLGASGDYVEGGRMTLVP